MLFLFLLSFFCLHCLYVLQAAAGFPTSECKWANKSGDPKIYFINMDKSVARRKEMERQLSNMGVKYERFRGVTMSNIYIPEDLQSTWNTKQAIYETKELDYQKLLWRGEGLSPPYTPDPPSGTGGSARVWGDSLPAVFAAGGDEVAASAAAAADSRLQVVLTGLYGRRRTNRLAELGCTISHLLAMRKAIYSDLLPDGTHSDSRYAIVTEDDVIFPFNVDWQALASSAPANFGILQLFNSNEESMSSDFRDYKASVDRTARKRGRNEIRRTNRNGTYQESTLKIWHERFPKQPASFWSTCAYLIDKTVMKNVVDSIVTMREVHMLQTEGADKKDKLNVDVPVKSLVAEMKIIAGIKWECTPRFSPCCLNPQNHTYSEVNPCVQSPRGFQADMFLYATTSSFVLTVPLITNGMGGNSSTFHQSHVENIHFSAFQRQRGYINSLLDKSLTLPDFAEPACGYGNSDSYLPVAGDEMMTLQRVDTSKCEYKPRSEKQRKAQPKVVWIDWAGTSAVTGTGNIVSTHRMVSHLHEAQLDGFPTSAVRLWSLRMSSFALAAFQGGSMAAQCVDGRSNAKAQAQPWSAYSLPIEKVPSRVNTSILMRDQYYLRSLCGMSVGLETELSYTLSHLLAIYNAVHSSEGETEDSQWAVVSDDDLLLPLDVNWMHLIDSVKESRLDHLEGQEKKQTWKQEQEQEQEQPAILLLHSPHVPLAKNLWWKRARNATKWGQWAGWDTVANLATTMRTPKTECGGQVQEETERNRDMCTKEYVDAVTSMLSSSHLARAYLIHKPSLRPVIDALVQRYEIEGNESANGKGGDKSEKTVGYRYVFDLVASSIYTEGVFSPSSAQVLSSRALYSPRGIHVSSVLLSLLPRQTYLLMYPLVATDLDSPLNGFPGNGIQRTSESTSEMYALNRISRTYMNNILEEMARVPSYVRPACRSMLKLESAKKWGKVGKLKK